MTNARTRLLITMTAQPTGAHPAMIISTSGKYLAASAERSTSDAIGATSMFSRAEYLIFISLPFMPSMVFLSLLVPFQLNYEYESKAWVSTIIPYVLSIFSTSTILKVTESTLILKNSVLTVADESATFVSLRFVRVVFSKSNLLPANVGAST